MDETEQTFTPLGIFKAKLLLYIFVFILVWSFPVDTPCSTNKVKVYFFECSICLHCAKEKEFLQKLQQKYSQMEVEFFDVCTNPEYAKLFTQMAKAFETKQTAVPITFIGEFEPVEGYLDDTTTGKDIEDKVRYCIEHGCADPLDKLLQPYKRAKLFDKGGRTIVLPFLGTIDLQRSTLPMLTVVLASLDSFNPCAFFVLFLLLSILVYAQSRKRMLLIGGIFVFFSGFIYFLFMSAWLNLFLHIGHFMIITILAGLIALAIGLINIKDFFLFKKGISLGIPEKAKPGIFERMRNLLKATSLPSMMLGTVVLAVVANTYEFLCTFGFPLIFTRVLTFQSLSTPHYYLYLVLYNVIYIIPLAAIVLIFSITLGSKKLTEFQGQVLKLISGLMMLSLGIILVINPALFNNFFVAIGLLLLSLALAGIIVFATKTVKSSAYHG